VDRSFQGFDIADNTRFTAGRYAAVVREITQKPAKSTGDAFLVWTFLADVDDEEVEVDGTSSLNTTPKSKPRRWMKAILGREIVPGEHVKKEDLVGRPCLIEVDINDDGWPYVADVRPVPSPTNEDRASTTGFPEQFAAKAAAAQAATFGSVPAVPAPKDDLPF
jgi:hypothetical protein